MRVTRENIQEFISIADELISALEAAKEACETWNDLQDEDKSADTADMIREAREEMDAELETVDPTALCELVNGKHKVKRNTNASY
jgi:hypothetical protein